MIDTGRAIFAEVCERVDDDAVKLVYADWLEEHGDEQRAGAVRLGVERRALDDLDPRAWAIDKQLERIDDHPRRAWQAALPRRTGFDWTWSGGLVTRADVPSASALRRHEDAIFAAGPITELMVQTDEPGAVASLTGCRYLSRVRKLLLLGEGPPEPDDVARLAECPALAGLRELELMYEFGPDDPLGPVVRSPPFPALRSLDLSGCAFEARGVRRLAGAPLLGTLHALDLSYCDVGPRALSELLQSPHLTGLRRLLVRGCTVETADVRALVAYPWRALEWLDLSDNKLGPVAGELLGASAHAARLRYLDVSKNRTFGDRGVKALARSPGFSGLRVLRLFKCGLTPAGLAALAEAGWLANLTWLSLGADDIGLDGIKVLAAAPLHGLRKLEITSAALTGAAVRALLKCPWLGALSCLGLDNNDISDASASALAERLDPGQIAYLSLTGNRALAKGKRQLRRRFGERVQWRQPWEA